VALEPLLVVEAVAADDVVIGVHTEEVMAAVVEGRAHHQVEVGAVLLVVVADVEQAAVVVQSGSVPDSFP
jgi:hypothetical protein